METLIVERNKGVVQVTMNRPHRKNAMDSTMIAELRQVFVEIEARQEDRAMVLTGAGGDFCSGADLGGDSPTSDTAGPALTRMRQLGEVAVNLHQLTKPTVAKVDGVAVGAGLGLAIGCDLVVASERSRLSFIFPRRGLSLDNGTSWLLPRLVGLSKAKELALFGDMMSAEEAAAAGLVNKVVAEEELDAVVGQWAERLARGPSQALSLTKRLLNGSWSTSLVEAVEDEARAQCVNFVSADTTEALAAFVEKREPKFLGR